MKCVPVHHGIPAVLHRDEPWLHRHSENGALVPLCIACMKTGHIELDRPWRHTAYCNISAGSNLLDMVDTMLVREVGSPTIFDSKKMQFAHENASIEHKRLLSCGNRSETALTVLATLDS